MRRRWWVVAGVLVATVLVATVLGGCSDRTPSLFRRCEDLQGPELAGGLPAGRLSAAKIATFTVDCTWTSGSSRLDVQVRQRVRGSTSGARADRAFADQWDRDDEYYVTTAVPGLGDSAYRFTEVSDDVVTVTVRAYRGYRQVTVKLAVPYPRRGGLAGIENAAVAVAQKPVTAS